MALNGQGQLQAEAQADSYLSYEAGPSNNLSKAKSSNPAGPTQPEPETPTILSSLYALLRAAPPTASPYQHPYAPSTAFRPGVSRPQMGTGNGKGKGRELVPGDLEEQREVLRTIRESLVAARGVLVLGASGSSGSGVRPASGNMTAASGAGEKAMDEGRTRVVRAMKEV